MDEDGQPSLLGIIQRWEVPLGDMVELDIR